MCDETSAGIEKNLEEDDDKHGGGPETDRKKERPEKFAKLYGSDHNPMPIKTTAWAYNKPTSEYIAILQQTPTRKAM